MDCKKKLCLIHEEIMPNPYQPRKNFDAERLNDLAESIKIHGIYNPLCSDKRFKDIIL